MNYIATKNQNKKEDKHPDFRLYKRDSEGNVITEKYTKADGTEGDAWKAFGAMWFKIEGGKIKSASISIDEEDIPAPTQSLDEAFPESDVPF